MIRSSRGMASLRRLIRPNQFPRAFSRHDGLVRVQRVQIRRPWLKRATTSFLAYTTATFVFAAVSLSPLILDDDEDDEEVEEISSIPPADLTSPDTREGEEEENSIFIPLALPYRVQGDYYAEDDPEWQTFVKFSGDRTLLKRLAVEMVDLTYKSATEGRDLSELIGAPIEVQDASLGFKFPIQAPPEYEQRGLEIRADSITWTTQSVPTENGDKIRNLLQPYSVGFSILGASMILLLRKLRRIQNIFTQEKERLETDAEKQELKPGSSLQQFYNSRGIIGAPQSDKARYEQTPPSLNTSGSGRGEYPGQTRSTDDEDKSPTEILIGSPVPDVVAAYETFKILMERKVGETLTPPKGVFFCSGTIILRAPKGVCDLYARGMYDPATKTWLAVNYELMSLNPSTLQPVDRD